ncbi:MAG: hypothetical protein A2172_05290 [Candidatus Woykebacteria bacterium RBG_13_40_15]|uniref:Bacteriophage lambda Replication protein O N-terminal domain-containing protein n=1 Tax=Candidatus Woykebacteria bacterium RBG_13_40_15 TaxID=1802593 RepID=A0A1G1W515_9BACT|nr:MAG: hypothetical protein A2172_05290 [Candidatus Woykebacteria bacterium RBG_13_40_15]
MNNDQSWSKTPNFLIEALIKARLPGTYKDVCWTIIRKTYGWHKKEDGIALSQFELLTGLAKSYICQIIPKLVSRRIVVKKISKGRQPNVFSISENINDWDVEFRKGHPPLTTYKQLEDTIGEQALKVFSQSELNEDSQLKLTHNINNKDKEINTSFKSSLFSSKDKDGVAESIGEVLENHSLAGNLGRYYREKILKQRVNSG